MGFPPGGRRLSILQAIEIVTWPRVFRFSAVAATFVTTAVLVFDGRATNFQQVVIVAFAVYELFVVSVRDRRAELAAAVLSLGVMSATIEIGGLAFLVATLFHLLAATLALWPPGVGRVVRALTVPLMCVASLSMGFPLLVPMLPLLVWAAATSGRIMRQVFALFAGMSTAMAVAFGLWFVGARHGGGPLYLSIVLVGYAVFAVVLPRKVQPS